MGGSVELDVAQKTAGLRIKMTENHTQKLVVELDVAQKIAGLRIQTAENDQTTSTAIQVNSVRLETAETHRTASAVAITIVGLEHQEKQLKLSPPTTTTREIEKQILSEKLAKAKLRRGITVRVAAQHIQSMQPQNPQVITNPQPASRARQRAFVRLPVGSTIARPPIRPARSYGLLQQAPLAAKCVVGGKKTVRFAEDV